MSDVNATDIPENATYPLKNASYREAIPLTEKRLAVPVTEAFPESPPICWKTGQKNYPDSCFLLAFRNSLCYYKRNTTTLGANAKGIQ